MQLDAINRYYTEKVQAHGASPAGVDWNGEESQTIRFAQLSKVVAQDTPGYSLNDIGCGYGALLDYLVEHHHTPDYLGVDISQAMVDQARALHKSYAPCRFLTASRADRTADYSVASGIFNVRLETSTPEWEKYILDTLDAMRETSRRGFAFNCLTKYSDAPFMRNYLHYADPCTLFDHCKRRYSRNVALLHDYELYEFTLIVRL